MELTLNQKVEYAIDLIKAAVKANPKHTFAFSGGKDSAVLLHLAIQATKDLECPLRRTEMRIDAVLSDTEFDETHDYIYEFAKTYDVTIRRHFYFNDPSKPEEASKQGKVDKFKEVLADVDCWFSGIRRDEGATRTKIKNIEEHDDSLIKINPIAEFTEKDVWRYLAIYGVPVNKAYQQGYRSLSCKLSSVAEKSGDEAERAGRWAGTKDQGCECGIHSQSLRA